MSVGKISLEEARAEIWKSEVQSELIQVSELNKMVGNCMQEMKEEGDPLTVILKRIGGQIQSLGDNMRSKFNDAIENVGKAIKTYQKTHQQLMDEANANSNRQ